MHLLSDTLIFVGQQKWHLCACSHLHTVYDLNGLEHEITGIRALKCYTGNTLKIQGELYLSFKIY